MSSPFSRRLSRRVSLRRAGELTARALIEPLETRQHLSATPLLKPDHIVVVIESDRFTNAIGDIANLPYVNQLAGGGLVFSNYQGINASTVGGETNYLGSIQGRIRVSSTTVAVTPSPGQIWRSPSTPRPD